MKRAARARVRRLWVLMVVVGCGRPIVAVEPDGKVGPLPKPDPIEATAWVRQAGGNGWTTVNGVAAGLDGTLFVTGNFSGSATFGRGEPTEVTFTSMLPGGTFSGNAEIFVAAYAADGRFLWARHPSGTIRPDQLSSRSSGIGIAVTAEGDPIVVGELDAQLVFGAGEPTETRLGNAQGIDAFVARYRADGRLVWARQFGGGRRDTYALRVAVAPDSGLYVVGPFHNRATFGDVTLSFDETQTDPNGWLARLRASDGAVEWVRAVQSKSSHAWGVAAAPDSSAVVVGDFGDTAQLEGVTISSGDRFDPMAFVAKYGPDGSVRWARGATALGSTQVSVAFATAVAADGSIVVTGNLNGRVSFGGTAVTSRSYASILLLGLDAEGNVRWVRADGGDGGNFGRAIAVRGDEVLVAGFAEVEHAVEFDGVSLPLYGGDRGHDAFVARFGLDGKFRWATHAGGEGTTHAAAVAATPSGFAVTGLFGGAATFSPSTKVVTDTKSHEGFVAHYLLGAGGVAEP